MAAKGFGKGAGPKGGCFICGGAHYAKDCPKGQGKGAWQGKGGLYDLSPQEEGWGRDPSFTQGEQWVAPSLCGLRVASTHVEPPPGIGWIAVDRRRPPKKQREKEMRRLNVLKPMIKEDLNAVSSQERQWKKVSFCVDSGAGETVLNEDDLPEVPTTESWGSKHGQKYEVANGAVIENEGEKEFVGHVKTQSGNMKTWSARLAKAQVAGVHRPLMSVKKVCRAGHRVVFDDDGSFIEDKGTGDRMQIEEVEGEYVLDTWVEVVFPRQGR